MFGKLNVIYLFSKKAVLPCSVLAVVLMFLDSCLSNDLAWELTDMFNQLMVVPNVSALLTLSGIVAVSAKSGEQKWKEEKMQSSKQNKR